MLSNAIAIDDSIGGAHTMLAYIVWLLDGDLAVAEQEFQHGIELSPSSPEAHIFYAVFLCSVGRYAESISEAEYGLRLNPTSLIPNQAAAWNYLHAGQPEMAEALARRTIASFPDSLQPHFVLGWAAWRQGMADEAVAVFERALGLSREALSLSFLGHVYARLGRRDEALSLLEELKWLSAQGKTSPIAFIVLYAGLGDAETAIQWLETAISLREDLPWLFTKFPGLDPLRSDPHFATFLSHAGLKL
jgi:tetratricopeptide (TPR) repeat protein